MNVVCNVPTLGAVAGLVKLRKDLALDTEPVLVQVQVKDVELRGRGNEGEWGRGDKRGDEGKRGAWLSR